MEFEKETALIEAVLFLESDPIDFNRLVRVTELSRDVVTECLSRLREKYADPRHGIELTDVADGLVINVKMEYWEVLKKTYGKKNENRLSRAAIETLSIIAYSQPITRSEIETLRGVSADNMIRLLLAKNFIKEVGKKDVPGKPVQYGTTKEFLKMFRLKSISDLPRLGEAESDRFELDARS